MPEVVDIQLEFPDDLPRLHLPEALQRRLHFLLDRQDEREPLTADERGEAEGW